jgi:hypothetical protein
MQAVKPCLTPIYCFVSKLTQVEAMMVVLDMATMDGNMSHALFTV